jgi:hypothetical protein
MIYPLSFCVFPFGRLFSILVACRWSISFQVTWLQPNAVSTLHYIVAICHFRYCVDSQLLRLPSLFIKLLSSTTTSRFMINRRFSTNYLSIWRPVICFYVTPLMINSASMFRTSIFRISMKKQHHFVIIARFHQVSISISFGHLQQNGSCVGSFCRRVGQVYLSLPVPLTTSIA